MMRRISFLLLLVALTGAVAPALAEAPRPHRVRPGMPGGPGGPGGPGIPGMPGGPGVAPDGTATPPAPAKPEEPILPVIDTLTVKDLEDKLLLSLDPVSSHDLMLYRFDLMEQMDKAINGDSTSGGPSSGGGMSRGPAAGGLGGPRR